MDYPYTPITRKVGRRGQKRKMGKRGQRREMGRKEKLSFPSTGRLVK